MPSREVSLQDLLRDFGRALSTAISESPEIGRTLRRLRDEGYSLQLVLDCKRDRGTETVDELAAPVSTQAGEPSFQINAKDLGFLRSVGIDPTRRLRRRRSCARNE